MKKIFLSSDDYAEFTKPKEVAKYDWIMIEKRPVMAIEIKEPLIGQVHGLGGQDIYSLYLVSRFDDKAIQELVHFPIEVLVSIRKEFNSQMPKHLSDLEVIAWARLYDNLEDATAYSI